jgi:enoyl-CoA hydratase
MGVGVERYERVAVVTVDRPETRNALDLQTMTELRARLGEVAEDADVRCVVLTGAGERAFVAGADIKYMSGLGREEGRAWGELGHEAGRLLETMPKATIAAVNGYALGGGCEMALACDIRYAAPNATFGQPEVSLGLIPGWGGTQRLARITSIGFAKELIFTGRLVDAEEALRRGLVEAIHEPVREKALETARRIAANGPAAVRAAKALSNLALQGDHSRNLAAEAHQLGEIFATEDAREGCSAFVEKRQPRFVGR